MNSYKFGLWFAAAACSISTAQAQLTPFGQQSPLTPAPRASAAVPQHLINEASSKTGTLISRELRWKSKIPLNKTYGELTPEQKAEFHSMYESLPPGDEPPFPLEGLKPVFSAIKRAQFSLQARGELDLAVTVGPDGKAKQVADYGTVSDPEIATFASTVLLMTRFKPAVCSGKPCTMQFPFTLKLRGS